MDKKVTHIDRLQPADEKWVVDHSLKFGAQRAVDMALDIFEWGPQVWGGRERDAHQAGRLLLGVAKNNLNLLITGEPLDDAEQYFGPGEA